MQTRGEHGNSQQKGPSEMVDSNPRSSYCGATVLTTVPPQCPPLNVNVNGCVSLSDGPAVTGSRVDPPLNEWMNGLYP